MQPVFYTRLRIAGLKAPDVSARYLDWILGLRSFARVRERRLQSGVVPSWSPELLVESAHLRGGYDCQLDSRRAGDTLLVRWCHRDDADAGVLWYTVARIAPDDGGVTVEHGAARSAGKGRPLAPLAASPVIVRELLRTHRNEIEPKELAVSRVSTLAADDVAGFVAYVLLAGERVAPVVLIAPSNATATPLVDPQALGAALTGLASVAVLADRTATYALTDALGARGFPRPWSCFDGGVRIYERQMLRDGNPFDHRLWLHGTLELLEGDRTRSLAGEVAERIASRWLPRRFFYLLEDHDAAAWRARSTAALARVDASPADANRAADLEAAVAALRQELQAEREYQTEQDREIDSLTRQLREAEQAHARADERGSHFEQALAKADASRRERAAAGGLDTATLDLVTGALREDSTPEEALRLAATLYGERVVVLDSALRSARRSADFHQPRLALDLLLRLATDYWERLASGEGDVTARAVFGSHYAATESDTVAGNKKARALRTFIYQGRDVEMLQHLRIGVKDSATETLRIHFLWDGEARRIVIGYCGPHLDFR